MKDIVKNGTFELETTFNKAKRKVLKNSRESQAVRKEEQTLV